jgi:hypothetical protein
VHWIYTVVNRPVLSYSSMAWWPRVSYNVSRTELSKLPRLACLAKTGVMKTTPIGAMEVLLRLLPLHIMTETKNQTGIYRLICNQQWRHKSTNGRTGSTPTTMGLVWYTEGFKTNKGTGAVVCR